MERKFIQLKTNYNNNYLYCSSNNKIILTHPIIYFFLQYSDAFLEDLVTNLKNNKTRFTDLKFEKRYSKRDILYYYEKYLLLKKNNYLNNIDISKVTKGRVNKENINHYLANSHQICFEVTDSCNLNCYYCAYGKLYNGYLKREGKDLEILKGKKILDFFSEYWDSPLNRVC